MLKKKWPLIMAGACWLVIIGLRFDAFSPCVLALKYATLMGRFL